MIKVKARNVEAIATTLRSLMDDKTTRISGTTVLKLLKMERKFREEHNCLEEARWNLLNKHGNKDEDGALVVDESGNVEFTDEERQQFVENYTAMLGADIEIDIPQLTEEEFGAIPNVPLAAAVILEPIINIQ
jgi:hypothetical protein